MMRAGGTVARKKRILFVNLGTTFGGAEMYVENLIELVRGYADLYGLVAHPELARRLRDKGVRVLPFPFFSTCYRALGILLGFCLLPFVVLKHRIDVIQINGYAEALVLLPIRLLGRRAIATRHLTFEIEEPHWYQAPARYSARFIYRCCSHFATKVVCVSEAVGREARAFLPPEQVEVIPNWVSRVPAFREANSLNGRPIKTLFVGRLEKHKGLQIALDALKDTENVELTVVGDGEFRPELQRLASGLNVRFVGFRADPAPFYEDADVFLNPSLGPEGMPLVPLEAMAHSVPCVLSDLTVHDEIAEGGKTAMLFRRGDAADLQQKLVTLIGDFSGRSGLAKRAHDAVVAKHSTQAARRNYLRVFGLQEEP